MFYEERFIDGVLMCRTTPTGEWVPVRCSDAEMLKRASALLERAANSFSSAGFTYEASEHREHAEALMALAARLPELELDAAVVRECEPEYEILCDDQWVAGTSGPGAGREARHFASVYSQDGRVQVNRIYRQDVTAAMQEQPK